MNARSIAGPTGDRHIILCPGFMTDRALWSRMAPGLSELGACTFADLSRTDDLEVTAREILENAFHPDRRDDEALIREVKDMALRMGGEAFIKQLSIQRRDGRPDLAAIACPTLVVWSRQDELRSMQESQEMADAIPDARFEIIEDCGHMTPMEAPESVLDVIASWLADAGV